MPMPSTEAIYHAKRIRGPLRSSTLMSGFDWEIRPFTEEQHWVHEAWNGLHRTRLALQMLEDLEYEAWCRLSE